MLIKFNFMDQTILFIWKAAFLFRGPFLKNVSHIISTKKSMRHMFSNIWWYMWHVFILVKTDSDYYANGQSRYKKFKGCLEQQLKTACVSQNLVTQYHTVSYTLSLPAGNYINLLSVQNQEQPTNTLWWRTEILPSDKDLCDAINLFPEC